MSRQVIAYEAEHFKRVRIVSFCILLTCVTLLSGCGSKTSAPSDPFIATQQGSLASAGALSFPTDGKPLSPAEKRALMSVGAFDKDISARDMYDVMRHFKRYVHNERVTIETGVKNGQEYIGFMRQIMRKKGLPEELVYLAFVESLYRPKARSRTGALGMWQFVSATGKAYGMRQDYWVDERYDVYESTRAAATYLGKLYARFDDWHLAVTSYNAGQGKISRGLKATNTKTFFELRRNNHRLKGTKSYLTAENRQYLPKFLAVCKVMRNLSSLGFEPMRNRGTQAMVAIGVRPSTDLRALARRSGIPWEKFVKHNPAFKRAVSPPKRKSIAYVPRYSTKRAKAYLAQNIAPRIGKGFKGYRVARGDTMVGIARKNRMALSELRRINPRIEPLKAGAMIVLPRILADASGKRGAVFVKAQKKYVAKKIIVKAPRSRKKTAWQVAQAAKRPKPTIYVVQAKDTIWGIARKFNVKPSTIMKLNQLGMQSVIRSGDVLQVAVN